MRLVARSACLVALLILPALPAAGAPDTDVFVPDGLARTSGMRGYPTAKLIDLLRDERCHVAFEAAREMKRVGAAGVPAVLKLLGDPDPLVERVGLIAAANIGPAAKGALPHALSIIRANDPAKKPKLTELVRLESALLAVGGFGSAAAEAVPLLLPYLKQTAPHFSDWAEMQKASPLCYGESLAAAAALSLSRIGGDVAVPELRRLAAEFGPRGFTFPWAAMALGRMRPMTRAQVDALLASLEAPIAQGHASYMHDALYRAFGALTPEGVPLLLSAIQRPETHPVARDILMGPIHEQATAVKRNPAAVSALMTLAAPANTLACVRGDDWTNNRRQGTCRKRALFILRTIKSPETAALFRPLLRDDDPEIAQYAREALRP